MDDGADDLDIAVELVNTHWVLATPPDRLTAVDAFQEILRDLGHPELARQLRPNDLGRLRRLRERLWPVFAASSTAEAAALLNPMLREAGAVPQLVEDPGGAWDLRMGADRRGIEAVEARLPAALSLHLAGNGTRRLGVCHAAPCQCVYVDRTRPGTRRFCCDQCNDRAAAVAYRSRRKG
jgi:predicted RNA-binding Zn ribbon-like protein